MKNKPKKIPKFKNEDEERDFWATHSTLDYFDLSSARRVKPSPNLKRSTKTISIRLPEALIDELKIQANQMDVPYQSLIKMYLARDVAMQRRVLRAEKPRLAVAEDPAEYSAKKNKKP